jgi:acyl-CoA thioester hydrolase
MRDTSGALDSFRFVHRLRVRWAEVDKQDIVFNGHYLAYFDVAITEYWRALGLAYPAITTRWGSDLFVVKAVVEYRGPARYDDELDIGVRVSRIGNSSLDFELAIFRGSDQLIAGGLIYVNADPATRKSTPVARDLRELIDRFEGRAEPARS